MAHQLNFISAFNKLQQKQSLIPGQQSLIPGQPMGAGYRSHQHSRVPDMHVPAQSSGNKPSAGQADQTDTAGGAH